MTVILNEEFSDITPEKDDGYVIYQELSKKLLNVWLRTKNMDKFIDEAIDLLNR